MAPWSYEILIPLGTFVTLIAGFAWNAVRVEKAKVLLEAFRTNDMHALEVRLDRIESKLDQHLQFHASKVSYTI